MIPHLPTSENPIDLPISADQLIFNILVNHDEVIKWKHFPRYWPYVWEFTGLRWIPRTKASGPVTLSFDVFFDLRLNKRLSKQSGGWWFEVR